MALGVLALASAFPSVASAPTQAGSPLLSSAPALADDGIPAELAIQPADWYSNSTYVPVLMYHYIRVNPDPRDRTGFSLSVTPAMFHAQMDYLARNHFRVLGLQDVVWAMRTRHPLPPRSVVLTFDDGYADFYTAAAPELRRYGFTATTYVVTGFVGAPGYLTWAQVTELDRQGFTIGAHTVHHAALGRLPLAQASWEMTQCKATLEAVLGHPVTHLAYPFGSFTTAVAARARDLGFESATSTRPGAWHPGWELWSLHRMRVSGYASLWDFARLVGGPSPS
jgi:peptidoglycan/xylan/chitin deacetylase (PgdA/CDA1 family)